MIAMPPPTTPESALSSGSTSALKEPSFSSTDVFLLIAKGGQTFPVPQVILAAQSEPLHRATTGPWIESQDQRIDLQEWDAVTVNHLVSFLYRGTYSGPETKVLSEALLEHAKVYMLAHYKDVKRLRELALEGIREGLAKDAAKDVYSGAVVELLRYVYSHTQFLTSSKEPLRELVSQFTADGFQRLYTYQMVELIGDNEFMDLRLDVMFKLCARLDQLEGAVEEGKNERLAIQTAALKTEATLKAEKQAIRLAASKTEVSLRADILSRDRVLRTIQVSRQAY